MGVLKELGSVIDVAEKTIEFQNFQNVKVPLEVVAGYGSPAEARFSISETVDNPTWTTRCHRRKKYQRGACFATMPQTKC